MYYKKYNNLENIHKDEKWLNKELKVKGYHDISKILLATIDINEKIVIYERNYNLISISTPDGKSKRIRASTVF